MSRKNKQQSKDIPEFANEKQFNHQTIYPFNQFPFNNYVF